MKEKKGMDCIMAEGMMSRYIMKSLSIKEMEQFLNHIDSCSSCYDELETQYIVNEALQQLSEEENVIYDFKRLLDQEIIRSRSEIRLSRLRTCITGLGLSIVLIAGIIFSIMLIMEKFL